MERQSECTQATGDSKRPVRAGMDRLGFVPLRCYGHAPPDSSIFVNALKHDCSKSGGSDAFADMARWLSATTSLTASFMPRRVRRLFLVGRNVFLFIFCFLFEKWSTFVVLKTGAFLGPLLVRTSARRQNRSQNTVVLLSPLFSCFSPLFPRRLPTGVESVGLAEDDDVQTYCLLTWMRRAVSFLKC